MKNPQRPMRGDIYNNHDDFLPPAPKNKFLAEIKKNLILIILILGGIGYLWWDNLPKQLPMPTISAGLNMKFMGRASRYNVNFGINDALDRSVNLADYYGRPKIIAYYRSECMECWPTLRSLDLLNMKMQSSVDIIPIPLTAFAQNQANQISRNYKMQGIKSLKIYNIQERDGNLLVSGDPLPKIVLLDRENNIVSTTSGAVNWAAADLDPLLSQLISNKYVYPEFRH